MYTAVHCINGKYVMYAIQSHAIRLRSDMNMCVTMNISRCVCVCVYYPPNKKESARIVCFSVLLYVHDT